MNQNPYEPPRDLAPPGYAQAAVAPALRVPFVLAAIGAWAASAYWGGMTMLIGLGTATGRVSPIQGVLPCVLIVLYALRGWQIFKGDPAAAKRIIFLHVIGGAVAAMQIASGTALLVVLSSIKVAIHVFGGVTAFMAQRAFAESRR